MGSQFEDTVQHGRKGMCFLPPLPEPERGQTGSWVWPQNPKARLQSATPSSQAPPPKCSIAYHLSPSAGDQNSNMKIRGTRHIQTHRRADVVLEWWAEEGCIGWAPDGLQIWIPETSSPPSILRSMDSSCFAQFIFLSRGQVGSVIC